MEELGETDRRWCAEREKKRKAVEDANAAAQLKRKKEEYEA